MGRPRNELPYGETMDEMKVPIEALAPLYDGCLTEHGVKVVNVMKREIEELKKRVEALEAK